MAAPGRRTPPLSCCLRSLQKKSVPRPNAAVAIVTWPGDPREKLGDGQTALGPRQRLHIQRREREKGSERVPRSGRDRDLARRRRLLDDVVSVLFAHFGRELVGARDFAPEGRGSELVNACLVLEEDDDRSLARRDARDLGRDCLEVAGPITLDLNAAVSLVEACATRPITECPLSESRTDREREKKIT